MISVAAMLRRFWKRKRETPQGVITVIGRERKQGRWWEQSNPEHLLTSPNWKNFSERLDVECERKSQGWPQRLLSGPLERWGTDHRGQEQTGMGRAEVVVQKLALNFLLGISTRWRGRWTRESGVRGSSGCTDGWRHLGGRKGGTSGGGWRPAIREAGENQEHIIHDPDKSHFRAAARATAAHDLEHSRFCSAPQF